jgi:hypothetical protein
MVKKLVDILGIVLPVLLIIIGFMRVGVKKPTTGGSSRTRALNSFTMIIAILLLLIGGIRYLFFSNNGGSGSGEPKPDPIAVSAHSDTFNQSFKQVLDAYYNMTEAFVNWDSVGVTNYSHDLKSALENVKIDELKKDTVIHLTALEPLANAKSNLASIIESPSLEKKRENLNMLSDNLRNLVLIVKYDKEIVFWQECPMAFNDEISGFWLSRNEEIRNPYLGTKHPKYKATMLACGETKGAVVKAMK